MPTPYSRRWLPLLLAALTVFVCTSARAAEVIPDVPTRYFNDYAVAVKPETADRLNKELEDLEKQTSNQVLVCIYPKMQTDSSVEDYTHRIYASWHLGQQGRNNAAVLFVFVQDHKMRIETGRGLEGPLPDQVAKRIIADEIAPGFKANDYDGGLTAGVAAIIAATKGEYQGTGRTHYQDTHGGQRGAGGVGLFAIFFVIFVLYLLFSAFRREGRSPGRRGGGTMYTGGGPILWGGGFGSGGGYSGGGGSSSSSSSSDGGGFFSAGGGDSGAGGGASGDW